MFKRGDIVVPLNNRASFNGKSKVNQNIMEKVFHTADPCFWFETTGGGNGSFNMVDFRLATIIEVDAYNKGIRDVRKIESVVIENYEIF